MLDDIICSLSGIAPTEEELMADLPPEANWLPAGWIRVTVERKYPNPEWLKLQTVKQSLVEATLQQIPPEHRDGQRENVEVQVDAQYYHLEHSDKYKKTVIEKDAVYISPPEADEELMEEYLRLLELLGIDIYEDESVEEEEPATPSVEAVSSAPEAAEAIPPVEVVEPVEAKSAS